MRCLLAALALVSLAFSAEAQKDAVKKSLPANLENHLKTIKSPIRAAITFANWDYYTNLTIPANGSIFLDSGTDYSSASSVQITVRSTGSDIANLAIATTWSVPGAPAYNVGTVALGSDFFFNNTGGATFAISGSQLRTFLYNTGPSTMTLSSMIVFTTSQ